MNVFDHEGRFPLHGFGLAVYGDVNLFPVVPGLHGDGGALLFQIHHRGHLDARGAVLEQLEVLRRHGDQVHGPVEAAVEGEVRLLGIYGFIILVVDGNGKGVFLRQLPGKLHPEGGVAALVAAELFAVEIDLGGHGRAADFKKQALARGLLRPQLAHVPAGTAVIVVAAVLAVDGVPGVGKGDGLAPGGVFHGLRRGDGGFQKPPSLVDVCDFTH